MFLPNGILGGLAQLTASWRELVSRGASLRRGAPLVSTALATRGLDKSFGSLVVARGHRVRTCRKARATR